MTRNLRILTVDDSTVMRLALAAMLDDEAAIATVETPRADDVAALRRLVARRPISGAEPLLRALDVGAVDVIPKPRTRRAKRRVSAGDQRNFDVVFFHKILTYFDKLTRQKIVRGLCEHLRPGGYLVLGRPGALAAPGGFQRS